MASIVSNLENINCLIKGPCCTTGAYSSHWPILTHLPQVPHICVSELDQHWFRQWFVTCSTPSYYLKQCWHIVNWTFENKLPWNANRNAKLFIHENAFENVVCKMEAILSRGRWGNLLALGRCGNIVKCNKYTWMHFMDWYLGTLPR